jgi:hypothetical protein
MKRLSLLVVAFTLLFAGVASAATNVTYQTNLLPLSNDKYDLGSTSPALEWLHGYFSQVCIQGDCRTVWPGGGGGGSVGNWFTPVSYGNATSTTLGLLNGFTSPASSTVSGAFHLAGGNGGLALNTGLVYSTATTTAGTGLSYGAGAFSVNTSQNIATLSNLTTNGFVKTGGGNGTLSIDTNTYLTAAVTSITCNGGLSGGAITSTGTCSLNLANPNTWTGLQTFSNASSTLFSAGYASSTQYFGAGLTSCNAANSALTYDGSGRFGCNSIAASGGGAFPFTVDSNFGALTNSTTTPVWFKNGFQASSTAQFVNANFYGTVSLTSPLSTASGGTGLSNPGSPAANALLQFAGNTGASTIGPGAQYTVLQSTAGGGGFTVDAVHLDQSAAVTGNLPVSNGGTGTSTVPGGWLIYGGGAGTRYAAIPTTTVSCSGTVSCNPFTTIGTSPFTITGSGSGGGAFPFSADSNFGQVVYSTSTPTLWFKSGLEASSTSQLVSANFNGNLALSSTTPWAQLSINPNGISGPAFAIGSSTQTLFSISNIGAITSAATSSATSTAIVLDWANSQPQVEYKIGTSATTITLINATTTMQWGSRKLVWICNPNATAGALTWAGVEWIGSAPTQTTTANQCDVYSFDVTAGTSTPSNTFKVSGTQGAGFQ